MIFRWEDGTTKTYEIGQVLHGITHKHVRPPYVEITLKELLQAVAKEIPLDLFRKSLLQTLSRHFEIRITH